MKNQLFIEIDAFKKWAKTQSDTPPDDTGGEWECNYEDWGGIYETFAVFLSTTNPPDWTGSEKRILLYIIARDNESGYLADLLDESALTTLTLEAIVNGHRDDKWQLAVNLHKISDRKLALTLLDSLVNDEDEYVNRRALMELAKLDGDRIEFYAEVFWSRNKYGEMDEYQKIAVLHSLEAIKSDLLGHYIAMAKHDGRKYLVENAIAIEHKKYYR